MAHILLVDDDGHIREIVHYALAQAGHRVTEAKDGALGWQAFQQGEFDLAILDIVMPELDGLALCTNEKTVMVRPQEPPRTALEDVAEEEANAGE